MKKARENEERREGRSERLRKSLLQIGGEVKLKILGGITRKMKDSNINLERKFVLKKIKSEPQIR